MVLEMRESSEEGGVAIGIVGVGGSSFGGEEEEEDFEVEIGIEIGELARSTVFGSEA